jgi:ATP-dependent DNA ligase
MSEFRLSPEAEAELDGIWVHIARETGSIDIATRVLENLTERFWLLARYPYNDPAGCRHILITAELEPSNGDPRIQPKRFPDLRPVLYADPAEKYASSA